MQINCNILGKRNFFYYFHITLTCAYYELILLAKYITNTGLYLFNFELLSFIVNNM